MRMGAGEIDNNILGRCSMNTQRLSFWHVSFVVLLVLHDGSALGLNRDSPQRKPSKLQN